MPCKKCAETPVIQLTNSDIRLCKSCFIRYFEKKALRTIKKYNLIDRKEHVVAAVSGGKDSLSLLHFLNRLSIKKRDFKLSALLIDEGIKNYRDETIETAKKFCEKNNIQLHIASYKEGTGKTLDSIKKQFPDTVACSMCGVLRRYLLNKKSRE